MVFDDYDLRWNWKFKVSGLGKLIEHSRKEAGSLHPFS